MKTIKKIINRFARLTTLVFCLLAYINIIMVFIHKVLIKQHINFNDLLYITASCVVCLLIISAYDFLLLFIFGNRLDANDE